MACEIIALRNKIVDKDSRWRLVCHVLSKDKRRFNRNLVQEVQIPLGVESRPIVERVQVIRSHIFVVANAVLGCVSESNKVLRVKFRAIRSLCESVRGNEMVKAKI